jgi:SNF2 family DNA or RNA helicase
MVRTREGADGQLLDSAPALAHALRQTLTKNKLANLSDLISDSHENIVVFYTYKSERAALLDLLAKKHKDTKVYRQDGDVHNVPTKENWGGVNNSVTLAQYQSGSTGIELTYANITVFYSPTYSYSDYVQSIGRTHRNGQTDKTIFYNFITNDTIEFDIQACLSAKQQFVVKLWQPG